MAESSRSSQLPASTSDNKEESAEEDTPVVALKHAINSTINRCVTEFSSKIFAKAFPTIYKPNKARIEELRKSVMTSLQENTREEVELIFEELNVEESCNKLDRAVHDSKCRGEWRPTGDVEQDLRAHLMQKKQEHTKALHEILKAEKKLTRQLEINNAKETEQLSKLIDQTKQSYNDFLSSSSRD